MRKMKENYASANTSRQMFIELKDLINYISVCMVFQNDIVTKVEYEVVIELWDNR